MDKTLSKDEKTYNNADFGITFQKLACDIYQINPYENAKEQFKANYNKEYEIELKSLVKNIFTALGSKPIECLTYSPSSKLGEKWSPHNFYLENGKTVSIRTNKNKDKIAPRVVGQCGINTFNEHFCSITGITVNNKEQIKSIIINNIAKMLPIFIDYFFISDYTVWIYKGEKSYEYKIIEAGSVVDIEFDDSNFTFTRDLNQWKESTTLKYKNNSLAEIQIHSNRTFKFRFIMSALIDLIVTQKINNETLGITAEKTICDIYSLEYPKSFNKRYSKQLQKQLEPTVKDAFNYLPYPIKHTGSNKGERGGESKCSYDFVLQGSEELSLKTNTGKMVCPPEVGQPCASTCYLYFSNYVKEDHIDADIFKNMVLSNIEKIFPIYLKHLFDSDFLLWIYKQSKSFSYKIFEKGYADETVWEKDKFSFTKNTINEWKESNTVKYDGVSIGEFQVHKARDCYKFRFNLENVSKIIEDNKNEK